MISELFSTFLQLSVFSLIPFLFYLIRFRKRTGFFQWIGFKKANKKSLILAAGLSVLGLSTLVLPVFLGSSFAEVLHNPKSVTGALKQLTFGSSLVTSIILIAVFKTALAEEILFRGFLAKRLISWLGFRWGNFTQALLFGVLHTALFLTITSNILWLISIFIIPFAVAYLIGYINEKKAEGSILPGWLAHGLGNLMTYWVIYFS
ncbi:CPBP family intramembrane glutamic endopeptidase [Jiulongibacter sediminis]|uniref:CAAX prenyl protease 2/Lysostaphin resistance protein A-like domain-containing protein n=1 Tax=Jiulongibacter sediminis TaxID=1605367 RepID=A0A0N8H990_9BACT|nr:CPBP family intramembrane glutamic endopeptidase [Jiulongibacter sediminis]KPM46708.1 hypothetical protein AFM12_18180 [Jiulongibacter sediminis]TBX21613.1 hypothetical protein TK44_18185 [Jiulongibacter sediminis]